MDANSPRWHEISPSPFSHERDGLARLREMLPDAAPFHAWTNFEFRDGQGKWHEIDALVLGERRLHLVELKHYQGDIGGNAYVWQRGRQSEDSPIRRTRSNAQRLSSLIKSALRDLAPNLDPRELPWVQETQVRSALPGMAERQGQAATRLADRDPCRGGARIRILGLVAGR
ncbi:nuclease-like protein [Jatrophihabitans sp. GAS493]|uniref:NERD domain-containing protein n=1 Tax=Jatrophihabitans sp. GAS493 TaxID=1907575 RepID=UPI000BB89079|nr:NERD domain-containing protein [Jatrophihabitans sp. GAS493]SOD73546.1 nuclease-like protein [Jatrophihabitans sp. GAS493]